MAAVTTISASATDAIRAPRRVEKPREGNALHGEHRDQFSGDIERRNMVRDRRLSQNETEQPEPDWNAPMLRAAFVAQVLGQVLGATPQDPRSAFAAYRKGPARPSLLLNARA